MLTSQSLGPLRAFRTDLYSFFGARRHALFDFVEAALRAGLAPIHANPSLVALQRRGWGSLYVELADLWRRRSIVYVQPRYLVALRHTSGEVVEAGATLLAELIRDETADVEWTPLWAQPTRTAPSVVSRSPVARPRAER